MRKSVVTGVFACALVFAVSGGKSEAASIKTIEIENTGIELALMTEPKEHPLAEFSEDKVTNEASDNDQNELKKHTVKKGDSLTKIAESFNVTWQRIFYKNTSIEDPNKINPGIEIIIPEADEKLAERSIPEPIVETPEPVVSQQQPATTTLNNNVAKSTTRPKATQQVSRGSSSGNLYVAGYCTWYVKNQRPDLPNNLGNAITWVSRAAAQGMATGSTPRAGAVGQRGNHVVYVQSVNNDGTVTISEMNHKGLYVRTVRTLPANYFTYIY